MSNNIIVYTDGGSRGNGSPEAIGGYGAVIMYGEHIKEVIGGELGATNNQMEMKAVIEAMRALKRKDVPVLIHSDSNLIVQCINAKWYENWIKKGWKKADKKPVENKELWKELLKLYDEFKDIQFIKVKGHDGVEFNERADELANMAMDKIAEGESL